MQKQIAILKNTRLTILDHIKDLSLEQVTKVPEGFNNNIQWNLVHLLVTQQLLCYKLGNEAIIIDEKLVDQFRKGTIPQEDFKLNTEEFEAIKKEFIDVTDQFDLDLAAGKFGTYTPYMTSMNIELESISTAIAYNNMHEGWHLGSILAMKRLV